MKKYLLSATFGFAMVAMLCFPGKATAQASLEDSYYINLEWCYCGALVIKCRPEGLGSCGVSSQIPCADACGD